MISRPRFIPQPLSFYHPCLHHLAVAGRRAERYLEWGLGSRRYCGASQRSNLAFRIKKHQSVLVRKLGNVDTSLQLNKVDNLRIVIDALDGILIRPGETFSFWKAVGRPDKKRGFKLGMELSRGRARPGIGGGICQASNLIFWLALHSSLKVVERHHHSFDPFPDQNRVLPFASGATVMFNYRDLQLFNPTDAVFQLRLWTDKKCLNGDLRADHEKKTSYSVFERNHRFENRDGKWFRGNELWRKVIDVEGGGAHVGEEFLFSNYAEVKYEPKVDRAVGRDL